MALPWSNPFQELQRDLRRSWGLSESTARKAATLITWADYHGIPIRLTSGRRSKADQERLYYSRQGVCAGCPVAVPGTSKHEKGQAFDANFPSNRWFHVEYLANAAGLRWGGRFSRPDPVHFEE